MCEPFANEISDFERRNAEAFPAPGAALFTGSSTVKGWRTLANDMAPLPVINRGFGGSGITDVLHYADRIVFPYKPAIVVLCVGENDIARGGVPEEVAAHTIKFFTDIHRASRETYICYISMKPSPARRHLWEPMCRTNAILQEVIDPLPFAEYIDVGELMMTEDGTPRAELFLEDGLHMNAAGYALWTPVIKAALQRELNRTP